MGFFSSSSGAGILLPCANLRAKHFAVQLGQRGESSALASHIAAMIGRRRGGNEQTGERWERLGGGRDRKQRSLLCRVGHKSRARPGCRVASQRGTGRHDSLLGRSSRRTSPPSCAPFWRQYEGLWVTKISATRFCWCLQHIQVVLSLNGNIRGWSSASRR